MRGVEDALEIERSDDVERDVGIGIGVVVDKMERLLLLLLLLLLVGVVCNFGGVISLLGEEIERSFVNVNERFEFGV